MVPPTLDEFAKQIVTDKRSAWLSTFVKAVSQNVRGTTGIALLLLSDSSVTIVASDGEVPELGGLSLQPLPRQEDGGFLLAIPGFPGGAVWLRTSTELKEAEASLSGWLAVIGLALTKETAEREMEWQRAARDHFFSMVNHDLKSPLSSIKAMADLIVRKVKRGALDLSTEEGYEDLQQRLAFLSRRVKDMASLIDVIGDVSNIERGQLQLHRRRTNLDAIVASTVQQIEEETDRDVQLQGDSRSLPVHGDVMRLAQVLHILLKNATDYSEAGSVVTVQLAVRGNTAQVEIQDKGRGIEPEYQARLFHEYGRAVQQSSTGLGIGLYIAAALVEAHQGKLEIESEPGEGTIVQLKLPLAVQEQSRESLENEEITDHSTKWTSTTNQDTDGHLTLSATEQR